MQNDPTPNKRVRILMIDEHPIYIDAYKIILSCNHTSSKIEAVACHSYERASHLITSARSGFDLVFLDTGVENCISTGEGLLPLIAKYQPDTKIVITTRHSRAFPLYDMFKEFNPAGILVKSDFGADELLLAFNDILNGKNYYTTTVSRSIRELLSKDIYLDSVNRQIITLLAQGVRTKSIPNHIHISLSAVEKRKSRIKDYLCIESGRDEDIVYEAKRRGFI